MSERFTLLLKVCRKASKTRENACQMNPGLFTFESPLERAEPGARDFRLRKATTMLVSRNKKCLQIEKRAQLTGDHQSLRCGGVMKRLRKPGEHRFSTLTR